MNSHDYCGKLKVSKTIFFFHSVDQPMSHDQQHIQRLRGENWEIFRYTLAPNNHPSFAPSPGVHFAQQAIICSFSKEQCVQESCGRRNPAGGASRSTMQLSEFRKRTSSPGLSPEGEADHMLQIALLGLHPHPFPQNCINEA